MSCPIPRHPTLRRPCAVLTLAAVSVLGGCAGEADLGKGGPAPAPAAPNELEARAVPVRTTAAPVRTASDAPAVPAAAAGPVAPLGAKYTVLCLTFKGPEHVRLAKTWKDSLAGATGRREFYVVHEESTSTLYFGYYREIEHTADAKEAARADADLVFVRGLANDQSQIFFPGALKVPLPVPDPDGPPEFDLAKLDADKAPDDPTRRYWSIAYAAYTPDGNYEGADAGKSRKQIALDVVRDMRKQGIEAYYYNGQNVSTVCIGAWPREALVEQAAARAESRADTGEEIVVATMPLPKKYHDQIAASGKNVNVFEPKIDFSPGTDMLAVWQKFPEYHVNGFPQVSRHRDPQTGQMTQKRQSSFLFRIPREQGPAVPAALVGDNATGDGADTTTSAVGTGVRDAAAKPLTPNSGAGRLRSIGR